MNYQVQGLRACVYFAWFCACLYKICREAGISPDVSQKLIAMSTEKKIKELLKSETDKVVDFGVSVPSRTKKLLCHHSILSQHAPFVTTSIVQLM